MIEFTDLNVMEKFMNYPEHIKNKLFYLRELIFDVANTHKEIGEIAETLKWNEPAYNNPKTGSAVRIDWKSNAPHHYMVYFNCKTSLIDEFKMLYPDKFKYQRSRAIIIHQNDTLDIEAIKHCFYLSLTYKLRKKSVILPYVKI